LLSDVARRLGGARLVWFGGAPGAPDRLSGSGGSGGSGGSLIAVSGLSLASGDVRAGDLFVALPGAKTHGARHIGQALAAGARAVLTDPAGQALAAEIRLGAAPAIVVDDVRAKLGPLAAWFHGHPARRLKLVGITGTNGKTTTAHLLEAALRQCFEKVALLGTIAAQVDGQRLASARTTLEAPDLQAAFAAMVERGVGACVMEVSSHALAQHRVDGFGFDVAVFTNLTRDHLDYHGSMEAYFAAKAGLFVPARAERGVVGLEDRWGRRLARQAEIPVETLAARPPADWLVRSGPIKGGASTFRLVGPNGADLAAEVALPGAFNLANAALAVVSAIAAGVDGQAAARGVASVRSVPGRMEVIPGPEGAPMVVVDYAHTPDAVAKALAALRPHTAGRLIAVLGAGGDRDHGKRRSMGASAAAGAELVLVTDDNPRGEDPAAIRAGLLAGAGTKAREASDRVDAIGQAIAEAGRNDTVVILGKGHERTIDYGGELRDHLDSVVAARALAAKMEGSQ
jgi:UDP-N-acetylmuramoyl-L-alanyl-D-glutamate--2,6-diaminopimelate ligase